MEPTDGGLGTSGLSIGTSQVSNVSGWDTCGCSEERYRWLGGSTSFFQHAHVYSLAVTTLPALSHPPPVIPSFLPPAALSCPQTPSLLFPACLPKTLPSLAITSSVSTTHPLLVLHSPPALWPSSAPPGFPISCFHVSFFTLNKPILPNRSMSFPTLKSSPAPNHLTIPKLQPQLFFKGELQKTSHSQQIIITQRFLIMYLLLPFCCPVCRAGTVCTASGPLRAPWYSLPLRKGVVHSVLLAMGAVPWQEMINEAEGADTHDWCRWKAHLCLISLRNSPGAFHAWGNMACGAARASSHSGLSVKRARHADEGGQVSLRSSTS